MTDLSTKHIQRLLAEATPGTWRAEVGAAGVPEGWDEHWRALHMGDDSVYEVGYAPPEEEEYANFKLAALAPQLAQEVLRMRRGLKAMCSDLHESALCNGGTDVPYLQGITEQAVETGRQIAHLLGDTE